MIMSNVAVQKVNGNDSSLPIFSELSKKFDEIRQRAFKLFEERGCAAGCELEDWFKAEREVFGSVASELTDKGDAYEIQMTLPGFEIKDVNVTSTPDAIIVHAASKNEKNTEEGEVIWTEFASNDIYRRFAVPNQINVEKTTAILEKGILRINIPKASSPAPEKTIAVKAA